MGIFTKYKTFCVEFLVLVLFGWMIMESQTTEPFATTDVFQNVSHDLVTHPTYLFNIGRNRLNKIRSKKFLLINGKYTITVQTNPEPSHSTKYYKTTLKIGSEEKIFRGFLPKNLKIWVTIQDAFIEIKTNHKDSKSTKDTNTFERIDRTCVDFGTDTIINLDLNKGFWFSGTL